MNESAAAIAAALQARATFVLTSHARPDGDAIGSTMALAFALERLGKRTTVVMHDPTPAPYASFPGVERIERADRVTTTAEAAVLLECSDLKRPEVVGLDQAFVVNIDHHLGNEMYGDANWFDQSAASCGEMVADVIDALGVPWTKDIAAHLFLAASTDTGSFRYGPISARTFELCRRAAETGINVPLLSREIFDSFSLGRVKLMGVLISAMELFHRDQIAVLMLDDDMLLKSSATIDDTEGLVNIPLASREVRVVAFFKRQADGSYRVSLRSKGDVDVRTVAAEWHGGGHRNAAGFTAPGEFSELRNAIVPALGRAIDAVRP